MGASKFKHKNNNNNFKKTKRTMKKIDYQAPEMEVIELKNQVTLLAGSDPGSGAGTGEGESF